MTEVTRDMMAMHEVALNLIARLSGQVAGLATTVADLAVLQGHAVLAVEALEVCSQTIALLEAGAMVLRGEGIDDLPEIPGQDRLPHLP